MQRKVLGIVFAVLGIAIAAALTLALGGATAAHPAQYGSAFFIGGLLFASPFLLACAWVVSARPVRRTTVARVAIGLGAFRWLGLWVAVGPVFAPGSLLLVAAGCMVLSLRGT